MPKEEPPQIEKTSNHLQTAASVATILAAVSLSWVLLRPSDPQVGLGPLIPSGPQSIELARTKGSQAAPVGIIEYADFECPFCASFAARTLPTIERRYVSTGRVLMAFRHLPLANHSLAWNAAQAAECAARSGKFWQMHDLLFRNPKRLSEEDLQGYGKSIGLGIEFSVCLNGATTDVINADLDHAKELGESATPFFVVGLMRPDGRLDAKRLLRGAQSVKEFSAVLEDLLSLVK